MNPKIRRRTALKATAAATVAVSLWGGTLPVQAAPTPAPARSNGLPPTWRLVDAQCSECNQPLGKHALDENDSGVPELVCGTCFTDAQHKAENAEAGDFDREDFETERDDLEADLDVAHADLKKLLALHERIDRHLTDLSYDMPWDVAMRVSESLRDLQTDALAVVAQVTRP